MSSAACRRPMASLLSSTGGKKKKRKHFFLSSWPQNRPNGFHCSTIRGRTPAVFLHSCDSSNETLIWLTHPSWCHGGGHRNYTPPERELYKNPHTHPTHTQKKKKKQEHTKEVTIKLAETRTRVETHTTPMQRDDVTPHTSFPLVLNALQAKWKWLRTWWSLSGFVKLEHGAIWAEQHSTKQYLPLHND